MLPPVDVFQVLLSYFAGLLQIRALWKCFFSLLQWKPESSKIFGLWLKKWEKKESKCFYLKHSFFPTFLWLFSISVIIYTWLLKKLCNGYFRSFLSSESWIIFSLWLLMAVSLSRQSWHVSPIPEIVMFLLLCFSCCRHVEFGLRNVLTERFLPCLMANRQK